MMTYELFKTLVADQIKDYLPTSFALHEVSIHTVYKANRELDCMTVVPPDDTGMAVCPTVYLEERYEEFKHCMDLDQILKEIAWVYINYSGVLPGGFDFGLEQRKDMIVMDIVNTEKNSGLLKEVPHRSILDLSVMYRIVMQMGKGGYDTILVTNGIAQDLGLTEAELFMLATRNTKKVLPMKIITMLEVMKNMEMDEAQKDAYLKTVHEPFVVTNETLVHGASYLAQPDVLRKISGMIGDSYYVIPSSVNEFFVSPARFTDPDEIRASLRRDNAANPDFEEVLSDNVYYFDRHIGMLQIA